LESFVSRLNGKRILVAGCASGIGAATAKRLAAEGATLFLGDINQDGAQQIAAETSSGWAYFDLADAASVGALVASASQHLGGLDGVANVAADLSAATLGEDRDVAVMDIAVWQRTLNANLLGFALITKAAIPELIEAGGGAIVNTSSGAYFMGEATRPAYAASKAGVNALTRHTASRWGKSNIRCNSIAPGFVSTEAAERVGGPEYRDSILGSISLPRLGRPEDIASAFAFFLSSDASWCTGQVFNINGGGLFRD
jgi:NAD(P)-dependent dehydrogenase (short-subunit alcohol dehydrogenase family)